MMFCRASWQRLAPLARKTLSPLYNNAVPVRQVSFGLPVSGTNIAYVILGGSSLTAALVYAYKTIISDSERYNCRIAQIEARSKMVAFISAEAAAVKESITELDTAAEVAAVEPVLNLVLDAEPTNAAENSPHELVAAAEVEIEVAETTPAVVEAITPDAEDVAADAAAAVTGKTAIPVSDLLSTVRIIAGSTAEIAAASIGDQQLVAAVRLAEEKHLKETLNGVELPDVKVMVPEEADVSVTEKAVDKETMMRRSDAEKVKGEEEEFEELAATYYDRTEADNPGEVEFADEDPASLEVASKEFTGEMDNDLALEEAVSTVVTWSEDAVFFEVAEMTSATMEEDKESCHETAALEDPKEATEDVEEDLQATVFAAEFDVTETMMEDVEEAEPTEATGKAFESGNGTVAQE